jgi:hypothetical protein
MAEWIAAYSIGMRKDGIGYWTEFEANFDGIQRIAGIRSLQIIAGGVIACV